jgi:hypothetical protein
LHFGAELDRVIDSGLMCFASVPEVTAASAGLVHTCHRARIGPSHNVNHMQEPRTEVRQLKEDTNMDTGMNEIRTLSAVELDAVSGGAQKVMFNFKVAGMSIKGGYDDENGSYGVVVAYGDKFVAQGGKV